MTLLRARLLLLVGGWAVVALLLAAVLHRHAVVAGEESGWTEALLPSLLYCAIWAAIGAALFVVGAIVPIDRWSRGWRLSVTFAGGIGLAAVAAVTQLSAYALLATWFDWPRQRPEMWARSGLVFVGRLNENLLIGAVLLLGGVLLARAGRVRARELATARLQAQLADARLAALAMELQPHFLFNALNSVATLVHSDAAAADRMITRLSLLLRRTLDAGREPLATLEEELEVVDLYLGIQQVRFGDRLVVERRIADETLQALVPRFILQPLVENALRHGLEPRRGSGTLRIEANREGERLRLAVCDDGVGMPAEGPQRVGTGLGNTRARLAHLYPGTHAVRIGPGDRGGSSVELRFPLELPGPAVIDQ